MTLLLRALAFAACSVMNLVPNVEVQCWFDVVSVPVNPPPPPSPAPAPALDSPANT